VKIPVRCEDSLQEALEKRGVHFNQEIKQDSERNIRNKTR